jgi:isoaspartyl peptidase/L-asparaginase-like protein (Ntn-hydrolase superfamily)
MKCKLSCSELLICSITIAGCGGYADDNIGAVSNTGHGESIMKFCLAHTILTFMEQGRICINLGYNGFFI